jgi:hypothetical protein
MRREECLINTGSVSKESLYGNGALRSPLDNIV